MKACKIEGCEKKEAHLGWCNAHYLRNRRHGSPTGGGPARDNRSVLYKDEYTIWKGIKARCYNKNNPSYRKYGARGITMSEEWKNDFLVFLKDVGSRPSKKHSIDRIDNDGNYEPNNCRWADRYTQSGNRSWGKKDSKVVGVWKFNEKYWVGGITINGKTVTKYAKTEKEAIQKRKELEEQYLSKRNTHH